MKIKSTPLSAGDACSEELLDVLEIMQTDLAIPLLF